MRPALYNVSNYCCGSHMTVGVGSFVFCDGINGYSFYFVINVVSKAKICHNGRESNFSTKYFKIFLKEIYLYAHIERGSKSFYYVFMLNRFTVLKY